MSLERDFIKVVQDNTGIINSICGVYFPASDDFKDARQDVILQLWRSFPTFRGDSKISTWIYKVVLNTILAKRKKAQKDYLTESISQSHLEHIPSDPMTAEDILPEFSWLVSKLDDCDKAIVMLLLEGYSNKEIATMLDLTATNVSTKLNRLKTKLKDCYRNEY
jgi:RNA polymerase sigma factor (sigma-70 family)